MADLPHDLGPGVECFVDAVAEAHEAERILLVLGSSHGVWDLVLGPDVLQHSQHRLVNGKCREMSATLWAEVMNICILPGTGATLRLKTNCAHQVWCSSWLSRPHWRLHELGPTVQQSQTPHRQRGWPGSSLQRPPPSVSKQRTSRASATSTCTTPPSNNPSSQKNSRFCNPTCCADCGRGSVLLVIHMPAHVRPQRSSDFLVSWEWTGVWGRRGRG